MLLRVLSQHVNGIQVFQPIQKLTSDHRHWLIL